MASVIPRRNAGGSITWRVQFRVDGRMLQEGFTTQGAAEACGKLVDRVGRAAARAVRARRNESVAPSLAEFTSTYLDPASGFLSGVNPGTRDGYRQIADRSFLPYLGEIPVDAITKQDVSGWITWQEQQPSTRFPAQTIAAKTIRNYHGLLSTILAAAVDAKLAPQNAAKGTALTRGRRQGVTFLIRAEFETVLHFIPAHYKPLVLMLAGSGMRWGEATAITWPDIDTAAEPTMLSINEAWQKGAKSRAVLGPPKTEKGRRSISLWPDLVEALGVRRGGADLVFMGTRSVSRVWSYRFHKIAWAPAVAAANSAPTHAKSCRSAHVSIVMSTWVILSKAAARAFRQI